MKGISSLSKTITGQDLEEGNKKRLVARPGGGRSQGGLLHYPSMNQQDFGLTGYPAAKAPRSGF